MAGMEALGARTRQRVAVTNCTPPGGASGGGGGGAAGGVEGGGGVAPVRSSVQGVHCGAPPAMIAVAFTQGRKARRDTAGKAGSGQPKPGELLPLPASRCCDSLGARHAAKAASVHAPDTSTTSSPLESAVKASYAEAQPAGHQQIDAGRLSSAGQAGGSEPHAQPAPVHGASLPASGEGVAAAGAASSSNTRTARLAGATWRETPAPLRDSEARAAAVSTCSTCLRGSVARRTRAAKTRAPPPSARADAAEQR